MSSLNQNAGKQTIEKEACQDSRGFGRGDKGKQEVISNPTTFPGFNRLL